MTKMYSLTVLEPRCLKRVLWGEKFKVSEGWFLLEAPEENLFLLSPAFGGRTTP
jgi:hypothetical protein